ncbi:tRNA preQ1(34) S-adenosylmethionine ribosyltransferase-isomerase QueA [Candidatus Saccharibacteria bacterium]|nr:tRNA preQ1(34) S-adenosylmethionine ribosyltransferase-isomerase QueA [Candidatus Saccharibacteria bacterium]
MLVADFFYDLPEERMAKFPPKERGTTRLLVLNRETGELVDSRYRELGEFLRPGDLMILNDTRVMRSRVLTELPDGRARELVVLEKHGDEKQRVLYRGKLHEGDRLTVLDREKQATTERVRIERILGNGTAEVKTESGRGLWEVAEEFGVVPLPPYLKREATAEDTKRYQTVWAREVGSAAAPTASLNMTEQLIQELKEKGVKVEYLTLHVGLGTFLPIRTEEVEKHEMHSEWFLIPDETLEAIKQTKAQGGRVVAVGTTVARTLEFYAKTGKTSGEDNIFIYPGFKFGLVDVLLTNFHAPKSTVLMLAAAFAGWDKLHAAYQHAVEEKYQFLSYGDSMLIM